MKEKVAMELVNRVISLSDPIFKQKNIEKIKAILTKNNYPNNIIHKALKCYKTKEQHKNMQRQEQVIEDTEAKEQETKIYRGMQYIPKLSETVNKQLKLAIPELTIAPKPLQQLQNIFTKTKTEIPREERTNAIYRIDCKAKNCPEPFYLGETERTAKKRGSEHKTDFNNRYAPGYKSALINHTLDYHGHAPDVEPTKIKILDHEENEFKRKIMESCYINLYGSKSNNYKRDANRLHSNYGNILEIYKKINTDL